MARRHARGQREFWPIVAEDAIWGKARKLMGPWEQAEGYTEARFRCPVCQVGKVWAYRTVRGPGIFARCQTFSCVNLGGVEWMPAKD